MITNENIHKNHRSRLKQKFKNSGLNGLTDHEILELLLFYVIPRSDVNPLAHHLLSHFGTIEKVIFAPKEELLKVQGVGPGVSSFFNSLAKVMENMSSTTDFRTQLFSTALAKTYCRNSIEFSKDEQTNLISLNIHNCIIDCFFVAKGQEDITKLNIRDIISHAIDVRAAKIILVHNHPSGNPTPSNSDVVFTRSLAVACMMNDIDFLDHIIVGKNTEYSFVEGDIMPAIKNSAYNSIAGVDKKNSPESFISTNYINCAKQDI
ncbi:MAG: RadC family protein [Clostridia bacterium]|nr:RadC family protein [Clostridia bacterium]